MSTLTAPTQEKRALDELHPAVWRASQLARSTTRVVDCGFPVLAAQLPGGGWPVGVECDLLVQQAGVGELRLIAPALRSVARRKVVFIGPPHAPQIVALAGLGLMPEDVIWVRPSTSADLFWAAEQALKVGTCGAVLVWATHARSEALRRLNLAAQTGESLFFMLRPLAAAQDASPAPLRLALRPAQDGVEITFVKRRGPLTDDPLFLPLPTILPVTTRTRPTPIRPALVPVEDRQAHQAVEDLASILG